MSDAWSKRFELEWVAKRAGIKFIDDVEHVWTAAELRLLDNYSCSVPSGAVIGKFWRRGEPYNNPSEWYLGEYFDNGQQGEIGIRWRLLKTLDPRTDQLAHP